MKRILAIVCLLAVVAIASAQEWAWPVLARQASKRGGAARVVATGGTISNLNGFTHHLFTSVGPTQLVVTAGGEAEVLVVAAGGGSGGNGRFPGGGAGGVICRVTNLAAGTYTVIVGNNVLMDNGSNSVFDTWTAIGGGKAATATASAKTGGSGGGGDMDAPRDIGANGTPGQGNKGGNGGPGWPNGYGGGGGGGAGAPGGSWSWNYPQGGAGLYFTNFVIRGSPPGWYGGGGGPVVGGNYTGRGDVNCAGGLGGGGTNGHGVANTGGGASGNAERRGGSGIVIVRYAQ